MDYKGHPVVEPAPVDVKEFHEKRGHGSVSVRFDHAHERDGSSRESEAPGDGLHPVQAGLPNGIWTIEGPRGHRTFRISTVLAPGSPQTSEYSPASQGDLTFRERHRGKRVLELLTGPDNTASYRGLAWYPGKIGNLWKLGKINEVLVNTFAKLVERAEYLDDYVVHFARNCYKCNRLLTTPESIERGIGPVCARGGWD